MQIDLGGKHVLVTGGSGGSGSAMASAAMAVVPAADVASCVAGTAVFVDGGMTGCPSFGHGG